MNEREMEPLARYHFDLAFQHQQAGRLGEAMREYRHSLTLCPSAEAHTFLGWAMSFLGHYEEAIEQCRHAIALDPDFGNPYNDIAAYLIELERWDEAQPWLELALNAPRYEVRHFAHYNLGRLHEYFGRHHEARTAFQAALAAQPAYQQAARALATLTATMN